MKVAWKVERGDRRTKIESGTWLDKYSQGLRVKCPVWSWTALGILPHEILKWIEGCVVPQTFILWDRRVLECEMLQSLKLSNISARDFLDGWPLGHRVLEYAWLAFQSIELMFTYREHLTSIHTKCEVNSLRLYRCLQTRNQIQKRQGPYV